MSRPSHRRSRELFLACAKVEALEPRRLLAAGDLDPTFGEAGQVVADFEIARDRADGVAVQPADGKVLHTVQNLDGSTGVRRFNANGTVDSTFGLGGTALLSVTGAGIQRLNDVLVQADGRIIAGGVVGYTSGKYDMWVARLTSTGALDTSFSGDGHAFASFYNGAHAEVLDLVQQPDGKILAGGIAGPAFGIARFHGSGALDLSFDGDGRTAPQLPGTNDSEIGGIALLDDGSIVAAGSARLGTGPQSRTQFAVARYTPTGKLDVTFGGGDGVTYIKPGPPASNDVARDLAIQADGRIVVVGIVAPPNDYGLTELAAVRLQASGSLDTGFASGGVYQDSSGRRI